MPTVYRLYQAGSTSGEGTTIELIPKHLTNIESAKVRIITFFPFLKLQKSVELPFFSKRKDITT